MRLVFGCVALFLSVAHVKAELSVFSLPDGGSTWESVAQGPLAENRFLQTIDFSSSIDGILPLRPVQTVAVPEVDLELSAAEYGSDDPDSLFAFSRHVAAVDVEALERVELEDRVIEVGDILIERFADFPLDLAAIQDLRRAL